MRRMIISEFSRTWVMLLALAFVLEQAALAELDVTGLPSAVPMRTGLRHAVTGSRIRVATARASDRKVTAARDRGRVVVAKRPEKTRIAQNLTLAFIDPNGQPVPGLPVAVTVFTKGKGNPIEATTDTNGKVKIAKINPLPALVAIDIKAKTIGTAGTPEWDMKNPAMACLLFEHPSGSRIAESSDEPYFVASTVWIARSATPKVKTLTYSVSKPITLVRNVVDLTVADLPSGTTVSWPEADESGQKGVINTAAPVDGEPSLAIQLSTCSYDMGTVPLTFTKKTDIGIFEGVQTDYRHDPYSKDNTVGVPEFKLAAINSDALPDFAMSSFPESSLAFGRGCANPGQTFDPDLEKQELRGVILKNGISVEEKYPEVKRREKDKALLEANQDGSQWWKAPKSGLWFRMRTKPGGRDGKAGDSVVESVRIVSSLGGSIAGVRVGDDASVVRGTLGDGKEDVRGISYMDGGLRFNLAGDKIESVDVSRPTILLTSGTTAFVPRKAVTVYVRSFEANGKWSRCPKIATVEAFKGYLSGSGAVQIVESEDKADYTLTCKASDFTEKKDNVLNLVPLKYKCSMNLTYSLQDNTSGQTVFDNKMVNAGFGHDYWKPVAAVLVVAGFVEAKSHSDTAKWIERILGVAFLKALHDCAKQAAERCPLLVEQAAYSKMMNDLYDTFDCKDRVTSVDYQNGIIRLNVGTEDGVRLGGERPSSFELLVDNKDAFPSKEEGTAADFYAAEVVGADAHSCVCKLKHIKRWIRQSTGLPPFKKAFVGEMVQVTDGNDMVRCLPDPATGVVSARMKNRFLPLIPKPMGMTAQQMDDAPKHVAAMPTDDGLQ